MEQGEAIVDLETADRELRRAMKPRERLCPQPFELFFLSSPREVDVVRPDGLGEVMRDERRVFVPALADPLEPPAEPGVQMRAPPSGQAGIGDLARQRVLDRVFAVTRDGGAGTAADEVAPSRILRFGSASWTSS